MGRIALNIIGIEGDKRGVTSHALARGRRFAKNGATKDALFTRLCSLFPQFPAYYEAIRGEPLTPEIVYNRFHKMYYANAEEGADRARCSPEHYLTNPRLKYLLDFVQEIITRGKPITDADIARAEKITPPWHKKN